MRKGISATNLIVALAVGLIVIVGLGYLVWTWLIKGGGEVTENFCRARLVAYCTEWSVSGYQDKPRGGQSFGEFEPDCAKFGLPETETYCKGLLNPID